MATFLLDKPGTYDLGAITGGLVALNDSVVRVTAPDVTVVGLDARAMTRDRSAAAMNEGHNWPAFVFVAATAVRCRIVDSVFDDIDGIAVDVRADDFTLDRCEITHMAAGVRIEACNRSRIVDSAIHRCDKMLRVGPGGNDDTGAECVIHANTPRHAVRHQVIGCYIGDSESPSPDYGYDGAAEEIWQASSVEYIDCVLLNNNNTLETGSHGPQVGDLWFRRCLIGALEVVNDAHYRRGLMFRPVVDSGVEDCRFFDLDHWDVVVNQGSATYAAGATSNFRFRGNQHACTRNSKAYAINAGGAPTIDAASETIIYGAAATQLAAQFRAEAIAQRDRILSGAGLKAAEPEPEPEPEPDPLAARVTALEETLGGLVEAVGTLAGLVQTLDGIVADHVAELGKLEPAVEGLTTATGEIREQLGQLVERLERPGQPVSAERLAVIEGVVAKYSGPKQSPNIANVDRLIAALVAELATRAPLPHQEA